MASLSLFLLGDNDMRLLTMLPLVFVLGCGSAASTVIGNPAAEAAQKAAKIAQARQAQAARASAQRAADLAAQIEGLQTQVGRAEAQARAAAKASRQRAAKAPPAVIIEKIVPVVDPTFSPGERTDLLQRAADAVARGDETLKQVRRLQDRLKAMTGEIATLREFASSPTDFLQTHGTSGIIGLVMAVAAFFTGRKTKGG